MLRTCSVFASSLVLALIASAPTSGANVGGARSYASLSVTSDAALHRSLYPDNVECKNFDKTGYRTWQLRDRSTVDLGNWNAAFPIAGAIEPGTFVSNGVDLFDVLEIKCGLSAE